MAPASQTGTGKWVTFRMTGGGTQMILTLPVNPDELQREHPGRITTTQTLGGAYQDINDVGITQLTLQGNTGWRGRPGSNMDGMQYALHLYKYIFEEFYKRAKVNPSVVELLLVNRIDGYTWKVSIDDMQVYRSKSAPLLFQYNMMMTVLQDMNDPQSPPGDTVQQQATNTTQTAQNAIAKAQSVTPKPPRTYIVQAGNTLSGIAMMFYKTVSKVPLLQQTNHIANPNFIVVGQKLIIPYA